MRDLVQRLSAQILQQRGREKSISMAGVMQLAASLAYGERATPEWQ